MINIIYTVLLALLKIPFINIIGDKGMGYYSIALGVYLVLMSCIAYGLPKSVFTLMTDYRSKGHYINLHRTVQSALIFALLSGAISAAVVFAGAGIISTYLLHASAGIFTLRAFAPCLIFISLLGVFHGVYETTNMISVSKKAHLFEEILATILSILGAFFFTKYGSNIILLKDHPELEAAYGSVGAALGFTIGVFIAFVLSLFSFVDLYKKIARMALKDATKRIEKKRNLIKNIVITMCPFMFTMFIYHFSSLIDCAIFDRIMNVQGHKESSYILLLGILNGKYEFFITLPLLIVNWYAVTKTPLLSRIAEGSNIRKIHSKIGQNIRYTMLFIIPCVILYILFSTPLLNMLFPGANDTASIMLKTGAVSIVFYSLAIISSTVLNALEDFDSVVKNAVISLIIQGIILLILMIIFQWGIIAVVISRIIFAASLFIFNEHTLREKTGYVLEQKRTFVIPFIASVIMGLLVFVLYTVLNFLFPEQICLLLAILAGFPVYIMLLVLTGGINQIEMLSVPGGKYLAPLCKKFHIYK